VLLSYWHRVSRRHSEAPILLQAFLQVLPKKTQSLLLSQSVWPEMVSQSVRQVLVELSYSQPLEAPHSVGLVEEARHFLTHFDDIEFQLHRSETASHSTLVETSEQVVVQVPVVGLTAHSASAEHWSVLVPYLVLQDPSQVPPCVQRQPLLLLQVVESVESHLGWQYMTVEFHMQLEEASQAVWLENWARQLCWHEPPAHMQAPLAAQAPCELLPVQLSPHTAST